MKYIFSILILIFIIGCEKPDNPGKADNYEGYPIQAVDIRKVKLTDDFWLPIIKRVQNKTIEYVI